MILRPKCNICKKACRKNQIFIKCKVCDYHVHRKCSPHTLSELYKYTSGKEPFYCNNCTKDAIPFDEVEELDFSTSNHDANGNIVFDAEYLNRTFLTHTLDDEDSDSSHLNIDNLQPIPDKYFNASSISLEECNSKMAGDLSNKFSSIGVNIRSLANTKNFAKLQVFLNSLSFNPSIIAINETFLRDNNPGPHSSLLDYQFISNCRKSHKGGGVGLYIKNSINCKVRDDLTIMDDKIFESLFVEIKCAEKTILFGTIYRSPNPDSDANVIFLNYLKKCTKILNKSKKPCIIQGDLNFNLIDLDDNATSLFTDTMFDDSFFPHISLPTRITQTSATCIDHIWSNIFDTDLIGGIVSETIADHLITFQISDFDISKTHLSSKLSPYKVIEYDKLTNEFENIETDSINACNDLNVAYGLFNERITNAIDVCSKLITPKSNSDNAWFDQDLLKMRNKRQRLYKQFNDLKTRTNKKRYDDIDKAYDKLIINKKKLYNHKRLDKYKKDLKKKWAVINDILGRPKKNSKINEINVKGRLVSNSGEIANSFNDYFTNIPSEYHDKLPKISDTERTKKCLDYLKKNKTSKFLPKQFLDSIFLSPTCPGEICDIISNFENKTSSGLDEISPKVFKNLTPNLIVSLAHIFNLSLSQGEFINSFKSAKVLPIYKKKDKTDMGNYRPISLLPVASKILEKIMHVRLYSFLNKKGFFYENQFGFRREHSTDQAAIVMTDKVTKALNKNLKVASVFLDMSKAFDCVDHNILLHKLYKCGIRGVAYSWFVSYLTGRYQKVLVNGILSENTCLIKHGVPQGSILGPLLYLIYVNDCNNCLEHSNSILYADDTTLVFVAKTYETLYRLINSDLEKLYNWLCYNKLTVNVSKTKFMIFTKSTRTAKLTGNPMIKLNGAEIEKVESFRFLGLTIDQNLSWKLHMREVLTKIQRNLGIVRKIARFLDRHSLFQLFHSLIMSHVRNNIVVWHHGHKALRKKIQACANKFLRVIFFLKPRDSVREIMKENNILSVNQIFHLEVSKIMQKVALGTATPAFLSLFGNQKKTNEIMSKAITNFTQGVPGSTKCGQSISFLGPSVWNSLPSAIKKKGTYGVNTRDNSVLAEPLKFDIFLSKIKKHAFQFDFV